MITVAEEKCPLVKGTIMQIWKSLYVFMFINFKFLILRILSYLPMKFIRFMLHFVTLVLKGLESRLILNIFDCFWMVINKLFTNLMYASFNVKSSTYYFLMKRKILADFQIYISVSLISFCKCERKLGTFSK